MRIYQAYAKALSNVLSRQPDATFEEVANEWLDSNQLFTGLRPLSPNQRIRTIREDIIPEIERGKDAIRRWANKSRPGLAFDILPVSDYYFNNRGKEITQETALLCLARAGHKTVGFKSPTLADEFLSSAYDQMNLSSGSGKTKKTYQRQEARMVTGMISRELAIEVLNSAMDTEDQHTALIANVRHSLPPSRSAILA